MENFNIYRIDIQMQYKTQYKRSEAQSIEESRRGKSGVTLV